MSVLAMVMFVLGAAFGSHADGKKFTGEKVMRPPRIYMENGYVRERWIEDRVEGSK